MNRIEEHKGSMLSFDEQHEELHCKIDEIHRWIDEVSSLGIPHFRELGVKLEFVLAMMKSHFEHEEASEWFSNSKTMGLELQAEMLHREHEEFLTKLKALIGQLKNHDEPFETWQLACDEFEGLLAAIKEHEAKESVIAKDLYESKS